MDIFDLMRMIKIPFYFLIANVIILQAILWLNRYMENKQQSQQSLIKPIGQFSQGLMLKSSEILGWEFEYARTTASEAMQDRYTMVNFYLIMVGVVASGIIAIFGKESSLPKSTGGLLLWLLCGIGWIYFLKIIRLRQAWHDSARTMGHIKEFYIQYAKDIQQYDLRSAFRWQLHTLPAVGKPWTVFFYSIMLIAFLNSIAYVVGGVLLKLGSGTGPLPALDTLPQGYLMWLVFFGLLLFAFHISVVPSLLS